MRTGLSVKKETSYFFQQIIKMGKTVTMAT